MKQTKTTFTNCECNWCSLPVSTEPCICLMPSREKVELNTVSPGFGRFLFITLLSRLEQQQFGQMMSKVYCTPCLLVPDATCLRRPHRRANFFQLKSKQGEEEKQRRHAGTSVDSLRQPYSQVSPAVHDVSLHVLPQASLSHLWVDSEVVSSQDRDCFGTLGNVLQKTTPGITIIAPNLRAPCLTPGQRKPCSCCFLS